MKHANTWSEALMLAAACIAIPCVPANAVGSDADSVTAPAASHWQVIPAATFVPRSSNMSVSYVSGGCVTAPVGTELTHKVLLDDGVTANYLRTYYRDEAPKGRLLSALTRYDAQGSFDDYGITYSTNATGYGSVLSPSLGHVVDRMDHAYVVNVQFLDDPDVVFANGFDEVRPLLFCGVRLMWSD